MNLLGFDTSTAVSAACVLRADGRTFEVVPSEDALAGPPGHARELMPAVLDCLERSGLRFEDLDAIAVGVGPGAFTGLRIGVTTARALALSAGKELRPVSSLAALAEAAPAPLVLALIDAKRGELFATLLDEGRELWAPFAASPDAVAERVRAEGVTPLAVGDGSVRFGEALEAAGVRVSPLGSGTHVVRGSSICRLAAGAAPAPPDAVTPDYLRLPDAKPR